MATDPELHVRLSPELLWKVRAKAKDRDMSVSRAVGAVLARWVREGEGEGGEGAVLDVRWAEERARRMRTGEDWGGKSQKFFPEDEGV